MFVSEIETNHLQPENAMKKTNTRKLALNNETLKTLTDRDLTGVAGGTYATGRCTETCAPTWIYCGYTRYCSSAPTSRGSAC